MQIEGVYNAKFSNICGPEKVKTFFGGKDATREIKQEFGSEFIRLDCGMFLHTLGATQKIQHCFTVTKFGAELFNFSTWLLHCVVSM